MADAPLVSTWRQARVIVPLALLLGFLLWGPDGRAPVLDVLGLDRLEAPVAWMVRFVFAALVMVAMPFAAARWVATDEPKTLDAWGLGLGQWRRGLPIALTLGTVLAVGSALAGPRDPAVAAAYPLFRPAEPALAVFWTYEMVYLAFFMANELGTRGILLFGLRRWTGSPITAVILAALPQLVWHLHKPPSEMWLAGVWGLGVGALAWWLRSAWWGVLLHWMSNVSLDVALFQGVHPPP